ncbi:hypothetical protein CYMTET_27914 [Cymbomonas tetramitiformis]|uniref:Response regulatory domain-containing protein n=1 Tax=Cymbomonas tetramitiformis TaxID=36881 RepID=A0AAE0FNT3_9CHLO|nr:hypothetical protein CYMTET_27914 [Cymbomonas tetramitiformis]
MRSVKSPLWQSRYEVERIKTLRQLNILDKNEDVFKDAVELYCRMFGVSISLVTLVDVDRQFFAARCGITLTETPREQSFCAHMARCDYTDDLLIVNNAMEDDRFKENPLVTDSSHIRFYAGVKLVVEGYTLGALCICDEKAREFPVALQEQLRGIAQSVTDELCCRWADFKLAALSPASESSVISPGLHTNKSADDDDRTAWQLCRMLSQQLAKSSRQVRDALRQKMDFSSRISDESLNDLNAIRGFTSIMRQKCRLSGEAFSQELEYVDEGCERLLIHLNNVRVAQHPEPSKMQTATEELLPFRIPEAFESCVEALSQSILSKKLSVKLILTPQTPSILQTALSCNVPMSGSHTVLTNLLQNAAQSSPMGGTVQVYVDAETSNVASTASSPSTLEVPRDTPGESSMNLDGDVLLHIKVQDSGAAHITEKQWLSQADNPFLEIGAERGLGLGLHQVSLLKTRTAGDPITVEYKVIHLTSAFSVVTGREAKNGEEAMKELQAGMVKSRRYDIVYTDLRIPVMDGFQLAEAIRSDLPDEFQPVMFSVTAEGSSVFHRCKKWEYQNAF